MASAGRLRLEGKRVPLMKFECFWRCPMRNSARCIGRARSAVPAPSTRHYLWKRALRILPLYWLVVVVALGGVSTGLLLVLLVALIRHVRVLTRALQAFQEQIRPKLEDVARGSMQARERLERLSEQGLRDGPDARIRP